MSVLNCYLNTQSNTLVSGDLMFGYYTEITSYLYCFCLVDTSSWKLTPKSDCGVQGTVTCRPSVRSLTLFKVIGSKTWWGWIPVSNMDTYRVEHVEWNMSLKYTNKHVISRLYPIRRAISEKNKGHKLLSKMGWREGESLGKSQEGIKEPVSKRHHAVTFILRKTTNQVFLAQYIRVGH